MEAKIDEVIELLREIKTLLEKSNQNENPSWEPIKKQIFGNYRKEVDLVRSFQP